MSGKTLALRQLSAIYLTAASAFTVAIVLSHHPMIADRAGEASALVRSGGAMATTAIENHIVLPGFRFVRNETAILARTAIARVESWSAGSPHVKIAQLPHRLLHVASTSRVHASRPVVRVHASPPVPHDTQLASLPPQGPPPPTDGSGLRTSENELPPPATSTVPSDTSLPPPADVQATNTAPATDDIATPEPRPSPPEQVAQNDTPRPEMQLAPGSDNNRLPATPGMATAIPNLPAPTTAEIAQIEERLKENLTSEMYENFQLFLYVSKAATGPLAQRMYVFEKEPSGDLALAYNWPVSTGREQVEYNLAGAKLPTFTPSGYYELDPHRFFAHYWSSQWGEPMPYAMFFNWKKNGEETGLAIHSASGSDVGLLGSRASAGCIRLPPEAARTLFALIRTKYKGLAPSFAIDRRTGTMSNEGILVHDATGHVQLAEGYKVLVFIEDFGGQNVVAALY